MTAIERPGLLAVVVGTATEVGKTWVTAAVAVDLRNRGLSVAARKPAQSREAGDGPSDAEVLAAATGEAVARVCPARHTYLVPMAPPMAAEVLAAPPPTLDALLAFAPWPSPIDVGLVETAGSVRSPQAVDGDGVDLIERVAPDVVVLVADAGLGTIGAVRMALPGLAGTSERPVIVIANRFDASDDLHRRNVAWLRDRDDLVVTTDVRQLTDALARLRSMSTAQPDRDGGR
jgi:dethiobiotin synthetase